MELIITRKDSRWLVNGKRLEALNYDEKIYLDDFFREMKVSLYAPVKL
jgi:hypothetical protein